MKKVVYILSLILMFASSASAVDLSESFGEKTIEEKLAIYKKINENLASDEKKEVVKLKVYEEEEEEHASVEAAKAVAEPLKVETKEVVVEQKTEVVQETTVVSSEAISQGTEEVTEEGTFSKYWNKLKSNTTKTWDNPTNYNVMIPFYAWHNRLAYDKSHLDKYNEEAWGLGFAMSRYDGDDDWHSLYAMAFKDSNSYLETMFGYAYQDRHYFDPCHKWFVGAGFTLGLTQRHEYSYIPVPLPLPMVSFGHRNFNINMAYVPGIKNDGNVAFFFTNVEF